jgi:hypothetical protein
LVIRENARIQKARVWRVFLRYQAEEYQKGDWLAGAGGFEPPNGGIKINRCLQYLGVNSAEKTKH